MTPLDKTLKRGLSIQGVEYVVSFSPEALKLTRKGRRLGVELKWADLTSGESALAVALNASLGKFAEPAPGPARTVAITPRVSQDLSAASKPALPKRVSAKLRLGKTTKR